MQRAGTQPRLGILDRGLYLWPARLDRRGVAVKVKKCRRQHHELRTVGATVAGKACRARRAGA